MNFLHSRKAEKNFLHGPFRQAILLPECLSLSRTLCFFSYAYFFQVPVTQAVLELAKSHWSLIYGGAVTKREGAYGSLFEKTKSALVTISKKGSCISSEAT